jgi:hypothetical protein
MTPQHTHSRRTRACLLVATALAILTTACGSGEPSVNDNFTELMKRPDIEQAMTTYTEMTAKIRDRFAAELGRTWEQRGDLSGAACGNEFPGLDADGEIRSLPRWTSPGNLPDEQWSRAEQLLGEIAATYGFNSKPEVIVNRSSEHDVVFRKPDGALIMFGTAVNTTLRVETGCHLIAKAHQRGKPKSERG